MLKGCDLSVRIPPTQHRCNFYTRAGKDKNMSNISKKFIRDEDGNVTVDWIVLCAGAVDMAVAISASISDSTLILTGAFASFVAVGLFEIRGC